MPVSANLEPLVSPSASDSRGRSLYFGKFPRFSADGSHVTLGSDRIKDLTLSVPAALTSLKAPKLHCVVLIDFAAASSSQDQHCSSTMASTPMDLDIESSPADAPQLNITRTLGANANATSPVSEAIANFRPTKVSFSNTRGRRRDFAARQR